MSSALHETSNLTSTDPTDNQPSRTADDNPGGQPSSALQAVSGGADAPANADAFGIDAAEARLQARLVELNGLDGRALALHAELYETLHNELQAVLAEIDGA